MDPHPLVLEHSPHVVDPQSQHFQPLNVYIFQNPLSQGSFTYGNYTLDDGLFYSQQQQAYHQQLGTPPSTTTTEDSNSCTGGGRGSPFDDENQLPTPEEFKTIVDNYLNNLSPKKRDKALVDQHRYYLIQQVLRDPRNTAISTAQFRFWVKKMFQLQLGTVDIICHDSKPVAIKEHIYDILVRAHREAHHGGRDKTSALVRRKFSWIPKELVARFVRHCPYCITRRNGVQSPSTMKSNSPRYHYTSSGTSITMSTTPRHFSFDHHAPPAICTPTIKEEGALSVSSADSCLLRSPNYPTMSYDNAAISSPRQISHFQYDRDDGGVSNPYPYRLSQNFQPGTSLASMMGSRSASSSTTTNASSSSSSSSSSQSYNNYLSTLPPPQQFSLVPNDTPTSAHQHNPSSPSPSIFLHQQNYIMQSYPNSTHGYCPNMLGLSTREEEEGGIYTCADQNRSTFTQTFPQSIPQQQYDHYDHLPADLLDHHRQQPQENQASFFNNANPLVSFANSNPDIPFEATAI